ncbi:MAG: esterase-like activity of phytase family protein, partial [Halothece sp. Uz-M2-17]|nr:esterase-like activity of phytase family protein [Halothece sp. Uz-M2-17]
MMLKGFAVLPADTFAEGPPAGEGISANGRTSPFEGQPVQGFSGVQFAPNGEGKFWFLSDNGFGSQGNSADYLLRIYEVDPNFTGTENGDGTVVVEDFIQLSDPNHQIPYPIINENTSERLLTGADFDIESFVIDVNGEIWVGDEFGPFLLHFDGEGKLLESPIPTPNLNDLNILNGQDPIVIGHRGASGDFPEHTLPAYQAAIAQGADFVEPDLVSTSDGVLIARHEPTLAQVELDENAEIVLDDNGNPIVKQNSTLTTNIADLPQFADRVTVKSLDGELVGGWFAEDFTLEEIKDNVRAVQSRDFRDPSFNDLFEIPTFQEVIALVQQVEAETGQAIGIYPETKHPTFFDEQGLSLEEPLIETLQETEFTDPNRIFIQSFEFQNLIELQEMLDAEGLGDLPLVQLYGNATDSASPDRGFSVPYDIRFNVEQGNDLAAIYGEDFLDAAETPLSENTIYSDLDSAEFLQVISDQYAEGVGPWKNNFLLREDLDTPVDGDGNGEAEIDTQLTGEVTSFVDDAHDAGLRVHPYTLRDEERFLTLKEEGTPQTPEEEFEQLINIGVDGFFTDFPRTGDPVRDAMVAEEVRSPQNPDFDFNTLTGDPPLVIAHRGASGDFPEHTLAGYRAAILQGADFIEPDLVTTKDGVLVARHEPMLDDTTNVAEVFGPERQSTKILDGEVVTAYFAEDFTLEEIKQLRAIQPRDFRDQSFNGEFEIPTFEEVIGLVQEVEVETGIQVGIYPETKHPTFFDEQGLSLEEPLVQTLVDTGFTDSDRIFIQSFELENLIDLQNNILPREELDNLPLVQLFGNTEGESAPFDVVANFSDRAVQSLEFLGLDLIPGDLEVDGTELGGLSGLGLQPDTDDTYYAISDDYQGSDARFYNLNIDLSDGSLDSGDLTINSESSDPVFFEDTDGTPFTSEEADELNQSIDGEGLAFLPNGNFLISSEGRGENADPFIREYTLDGSLVNELPVDDKHLSTIDPGNSGVRGSGGFESLTITPDNQFLLAGNEKTLLQDGPGADFGQVGLSRIVKYDLETGEPLAEFVYEVTANTLISEDDQGNPDLDGAKGSGLVELLALNENRLFALEREFVSGVTDGEGSRPIRLYEIDLSNATNVIDHDSLEGESFTPVSKRLVLDFEELLSEEEFDRIGSMEALAFGPDLPDGRKVLLVMEDNDFSINDGDRDIQVAAFAINPYEFDQSEAEAIYGETLATLLDFSESPTYEDLANPDALEAISVYAEGLGFSKNNIILGEELDTPVDGNGDGVAEIETQLTGEISSLVEDAHAANLQVHPYTLRNEEHYLTLKEDGTQQTPGEEVEQLIAIGADGFFTDFPGTGSTVLEPLVKEPNLPTSRGFEGMAFSPDRTTAYPLLEGSVTGDPNTALRIYEFDLTSGQYEEEMVGFYEQAEANHAIGDFTPINNNEFLVIERDGGQAENAEFKKVFKVDFSEIDDNGFVEKEELVDLLNIPDPDDLNGDGKTTYTMPFVTIEDVLVIDENTILIANDNNYPFSVGRPPEIDNNEIVLIELEEFLNLDSRLGAAAIEDSSPDPLFGTLESDTFDGAIALNNFDAQEDFLFTGAGEDIVDTSTGAKNQIYTGKEGDELF